MPPAMYGKVNWRLKQRSVGKDVNDWDSKYGCNGPCWAYWALGLIGIGGVYGLITGNFLYHCLSCMIKLRERKEPDELDELGLIAGLQRAQIRGTYGIEGNCVEDLAAGCFCAPCVLMQNDREIRAREGHTRLVNNKKYKALPRKSLRRVSVVYQQPRREPQMVAPGLFKLPKGTSPAQSRRESIAMTPIYSDDDTARHQGGCEKRESGPPRKQALRPNIAAKVRTPAQEHERSEEYQQSEEEQSKAETSKRIQNHLAKRSELVIVKKRNSAPAIVPIVVVTGPKDSSRARMDAKALSQVDPSESSDQRSKEHGLVECSTLEMIDEVDSRPGQETPMGGTQIEATQKCRLDSHPLSDCTPTVKLIPAPTVPVDQHALAECTTTPSPLSKVQELSYVHDFADCPSTVLKYYKKGGKNSQPQDLEHRGRESSASNAKPANRTQKHFPENRARESSASNAGPANGVQEHILENCTEESPARNGRPVKRVQEHLLEECARESPISNARPAKGVQEHILENCTEESSIRNARPAAEVQEHFPEGCPIGSSGSRENAGKEAPRDNNSARSATDAWKDMDGIHQHDFEDVDPYAKSVYKSSLAATTASDSQHRSTGGISSISPPMLVESSKCEGVTPHQLSTCSVLKNVANPLDNVSSVEAPMSRKESLVARAQKWIAGSGGESPKALPKGRMEDLAEELLKEHQEGHKCSGDKGKGRANENIAQAEGSECSRSAENNAQHLLERILAGTTDGKKEKDRGNVEVLKSHLNVGSE
jgi:Cys-rich protein (TIGR01571 family)